MKVLLAATVLLLPLLGKQASQSKLSPAYPRLTFEEGTSTRRALRPTFARLCTAPKGTTNRAKPR